MSSGHPQTPKKVYKASESMNVGCYRLCKSVGDTRNLGEIFTAKPESTTSGRGREAFIWRSTSTGHMYFVGRPRERRPNNFRVHDI